MESIIYKHTIFININNKVIRHVVDEINLSDEGVVNPIGTDEEYTVTFSKASDMFRIVYHSNDDSRYRTEKIVLKDFRSKCSKESVI
jgi:hypothetical protein